MPLKVEIYKLYKYAFLAPTNTQFENIKFDADELLKSGPHATCMSESWNRWPLTRNLFKKKTSSLWLEPSHCDHIPISPMPHPHPLPYPLPYPLPSPTHIVFDPSHDHIFCAPQREAPSAFSHAAAPALAVPAASVQLAAKACEAFLDIGNHKGISSYPFQMSLISLISWHKYPWISFSH